MNKKFKEKKKVKNLKKFPKSQLFCDKLVEN